MPARRFSLILILFGLVALIAGIGPAPDRSDAAFPGINGKIAFHSDRDGDFDIYVMDLLGGNQTNLTNNTAHDEDPAWSPDGSQIVFATTRDNVPTGGPEIYTMNADGSGSTRLTDNLESDAQPSWSPDGSKITFRSFRDGDGEVYVMDADGGNQTNLTNNTAADGAGA